LATIDPVMPQNRHEYDLPGHRVAGDRSPWEYVHLAIDDQSHRVFTPIEPAKRGTGACKALIRTVLCCRCRGVCSECVDRHRYPPRSFRFQRLVCRLDQRYLRKRPHAARASGKAQWLMRTRQRAGLCPHPRQLRTACHALQGRLHDYGWYRPRQTRLQASHFAHTAEQRAGFAHTDGARAL